jgi:hypothetical protein
MDFWSLRDYRDHHRRYQVIVALGVLITACSLFWSDTTRLVRVILAVILVGSQLTPSLFTPVPQLYWFVGATAALATCTQYSASSVQGVATAVFVYAICMHVTSKGKINLLVPIICTLTTQLILLTVSGVGTVVSDVTHQHH